MIQFRLDRSLSHGHGRIRNWSGLSRESNEMSSYRNRMFARPLGGLAWSIRDVTSVAIDVEKEGKLLKR